MSRPTHARPLSIDPVLARLADRACPDGGHRYGCRDMGCDAAVADALGTSRRNLLRWKSDGLTITAADSIAVALGTHPAELWGLTEWNLALDVHEDALRRWARAHPTSTVLEELDA